MKGKIALTKEMKIALLKALQSGEIDLQNPEMQPLLEAYHATFPPITFVEVVDYGSEKNKNQLTQ